MRISWRIFWTAAAAAMIVTGLARAEPAETPADNPSVGVGMICNTAEQAEHYIALRAKGAEIQLAANAVNAEAHNPRACGVAAIAFIRGEVLGSKTVDGREWQVVRVNVIAGYNDTGWHRVIGMVQYAVIASQGQTI
jgi:hypothetical protein